MSLWEVFAKPFQRSSPKPETKNDYGFERYCHCGKKLEVVSLIEKTIYHGYGMKQTSFVKEYIYLKCPGRKKILPSFYAHDEERWSREKGHHSWDKSGYY